MRINPLQSIGILVVTIVAAMAWQGEMLSQGNAEAKETRSIFVHHANDDMPWWLIRNVNEPYVPPARPVRRATRRYVGTELADNQPERSTATRPKTERGPASVHAAQRPSYRVRSARIVAAASVLPSPRIQPLLPVVDQDDIKDHHRKIADEVLRSLPEQCRGNLKNFYVRYDNPESRGLGGKDTIILSGNVPLDEFRALLIHELGHVFDLNQNVDCLGGSPSAGASEFRDGKDIVYNDDPSLEFYRISWVAPKVQKSTANPEDFVSGYAAWDVFEDFAESLTYFVLHNDAFRQRAQTNEVLAAKYAWFQRHLFPQTPSLATGYAPWRNDVPWDITKLPYDWHGHSAVAQSS